MNFMTARVPLLCPKHGTQMRCNEDCFVVAEIKAGEKRLWLECTSPSEHEVENIYCDPCSTDQEERMR